MKLKEVLDRTVQFLKAKNFETPRLDTEILLTEALGLKNRVDLYLKFDQPLKEDELNRSREFVRRRAQGEPVAYIIGRKDFFGYTFKVNSNVLIPRPETEILVEEALVWIQKQQLESPQILDLGCGSGCIGLSVLKKIPGAQLTSVDLSEGALQVAQSNAQELGVSDRVQWVHSDCGSLRLTGKSFDLVLANPPYISEDDPDVQKEVRQYEPSTALFAPQDGLKYIREWSQLATSAMKEKSFLGFEMGSKQGPLVQQFFKDLEFFDELKLVRDLAGLDRHMIGVKNG